MISIISDKNEIFNIEPNVIHNRYDMLYSGDFDLLKCNKEIIPIHINGNTCNVGLYLRKISQNDLDELKQYIFKNYKDIYDLKILHTYTEIDGIVAKPHWHVNLPKTIDEFDKMLHSKVRYNTKWYPKKIKQDIGEYTFKKYTSEKCPSYIIELYLNWKKHSHNFEWNKSSKDYLKEFGVTTIYVMETTNTVLAIGFTCETGKNVFFENFSFNHDFAKYSCGMVLYHYIIKDLIDNNKETLYLLGGDLDYKKRYNGIKTLTYSGYIYRNPNFVKILTLIGNLLTFLFPIKRLRKLVVEIFGSLCLSKYYKHFLRDMVLKEQI